MPGNSSQPDFGLVANEYARYRLGFPPELFDRLARGFGIGQHGQRVLDIGTGTGTVARALAQRGCQVTGLDRSPQLLAEAERLTRAEGLDVRYVESVAEATGLPAGSFDVATAAVCWHWFDAKRAALEMRRVLVPGGSLVIIQLDWLLSPGNVVEATEALMRRHRSILPGRDRVERLAKAIVGRIRPAWIAGRCTGIHPQNLTTLAAAGFTGLESFSFDVKMPYDHESWRGRIRSHAWVGASQSDSRVARLDAELDSLLKERFRDEPLSVPHRIFVIVGRNP